MRARELPSEAESRFSLAEEFRFAFRTGIVLFASVLSFSLSPSVLTAQVQPAGSRRDSGAEPKALRSLRTFEPSYIDATISPCQDFYRYACGEWIKANPVPADEERVFIAGQMNDRNFYLLYTELRQAAASPATPLQRKYGSFFRACMDADQADKLGVMPLQPTIAAIRSLQKKTELASLLSDQRYLVKGFFTITVEQDAKNSQKQLPTIRQAG